MTTFDIFEVTPDGYLALQYSGAIGDGTETSRTSRDIGQSILCRQPCCWGPTTYCGGSK